jgi:hypothetical protein
MWDEDQHITLDVRLGPVNRTASPCGENSETLSTTLSTGNLPFQFNPYIGETIFGCPYLGVAFPANLISFTDFST